MTIIKSSTLEALRTSFSAAFQAGLDSAPSFYPQVAMEMPSSTKLNTYGFLEKLPQMREWLGPRVAQNLVERPYTLENKPWELTVSVPRENIEDDNLGIYGPMFREMGMSVRQHPDKMIAELLENGHSTSYGAAIGYDGLPFFSASHAVGGAAPATQSNYLTNKALASNTFDEARQALWGFKGYDGLPLNAQAGRLLLVVPPQLERTARVILEAEMIAEGGVSVTNVQRGSADLLVCPFLTDATDWYLLNASRAIKPFIVQIRKAPQFVARDNPNDDNVFNLREYVYGIDARMGFGVSLWWMGIKCKGES